MSPLSGDSWALEIHNASVAQWKSNRLISDRPLDRSQPEAPINKKLPYKVV